MNAKQAIEKLSARITPTRYAKMLRALEFRTRRLTLVLEDIFQEHNAAAALRNCDAFGLQDIHLIENRYRLRISSHVDMGVSKWQTLHRYTCSEARRLKDGMKKNFAISDAARENTRAALESVRARGYLLAASTLRDGAKPLEEIPADRPVAVLVGTELTGLSDVAHDMADIAFAMPMAGFAQSFNLSVFTALCLSKLSERMRAHSDEWKMSEPEKEELLLGWLKLCRSDEVEAL